jgi:hypothetical protein
MGPANRGFFFYDFGLELLWVSHPAEAQSEDSRSAAGMAPPWVYGSDGVLVLYYGVTRATRIVKLSPGTPIRVEVIGKLPKASAADPKIGDVPP